MCPQSSGKKKTSFGLENIEQTLRGVLMEKEKSNC